MDNWLNIAGRVAVVTGGSSGIGKSIVQSLLAQGVKVANLDIQQGELQAKNLLFIPTDVTNEEEVKEAIEQTVERFGRIDGVINNAGINIPSLLVDPEKKYEMNEKDFDKILSINIKGVFHVTQAVVRKLLPQKKGVVINMSSECGLEGSEGQSPYAASKAAVNGLTRSWSKELAKHNIRVVGIAPGIMEETGLRTLAYEQALSYTRGKTVDELRAGYANVQATPLGRSGRLDEVADLVCYYFSDRSSYITGITTNVAGGKTRG